MDPIVYVLVSAVVFSMGMLWYCSVSAMLEANRTRRQLAYETRDDATIKTYEDEKEIETEYHRKQNNPSDGTPRDTEHDEENPPNTKQELQAQASSSEEEVENDAQQQTAKPLEPTNGPRSTVLPSMVVIDIEILGNERIPPCANLFRRPSSCSIEKENSVDDDDDDDIAASDNDDDDPEQNHP